MLWGDVSALGHGVVRVPPVCDATTGAVTLDDFERRVRSLAELAAYKRERRALEERRTTQ